MRGFMIKCVEWGVFNIPYLQTLLYITFSFTNNTHTHTDNNNLTMKTTQNKTNRQIQRFPILIPHPFKIYTAQWQRSGKLGKKAHGMPKKETSQKSRKSFCSYYNLLLSFVMNTEKSLVYVLCKKNPYFSSSFFSCSLLGFFSKAFLATATQFSFRFHWLYKHLYTPSVSNPHPENAILFMHSLSLLITINIEIV